MKGYAEIYADAKQALAHPEKLLSELDRVLAAAQPEVDRVADAVREAEMALVARLDPWWTGRPQPNIHAAVLRIVDNLHDPLVVGLALRLAAGYARQGRVDDDAYRLAILAGRLEGTGLPHPDASYAQEGRRHCERALFVPSHAYAYELVRHLPYPDAAEQARQALARGNAPLAVMFAELSLVAALDSWYLGPPLPNIEKALVRYREERPPELLELAIVLARSYVSGEFVDLRARDHVRAVLDGEEVKHLSPDEAIRCREFVDRDCFDYPYEVLYRRVKTQDFAELQEAVSRRTRAGSLEVAQRMCEMFLVRRLADWRFGEAEPRIERALLLGRAQLEGEQALAAEVEWALYTLAGLYLAGLHGPKAARELVRAVIAQAPDHAALVASIQAAGIPADVSVAELAEVYRETVDIEARVEAFRAQCDALGGLNDYERAAYREVLEFLEQGDGWLLSNLSRTLGDLVGSAAPQGLVRSATAAVENALRVANGGAGSLLRRDRILAELARRDPALRSLDRLREAKLELLDEVAWAITRENRIAAALEGFGCGLGGPTLLLVDLPVLILVNLNAIAAVATAYGFDPEGPEERDLALAILSGGAEALAQLATLEHERDPDALEAMLRKHLTGNTALALHAGAARAALRLLRQKLLQVIPILGGAVGAGLNFHYTATTTRTAVMAYRLRWLVRRFEGRG
ncbi:MAG: EcsC family protein [Planctomycetes bacterium]|nr:EcsC family protein [Planctomycetota bacterium]